MPFSFLNVWLWLGALAVAAPLWLHLRRRKETNLLRFSALQFLEDEPQPRRGPLRLRDVLLFTARVLAVLLLAGAFAWPYLRGADTAPIRESLVYLLDNTLSHQANGGFVRDRDRVANELSRTGADVQIAVVELTLVPRVVAAFGDDRALAQQKVRNLQPSFSRGSYLAAFRQANALLNNSLGARRRIVFLGDNQKNQWAENVNTPPFLRQVEIDVPKAGVASLPNLWLCEPRVQRIFLGDKSLVHFTGKLGHTGAAKKAKLLLRANGQTVLNRALDLEQQPEILPFQAQWEAEPGSWLSGEAIVEGTPDALPADNRVYFSLAPVVEGKVLLLAQSAYLRLGLSPEVMRGQWAARLLEPTQLESELSSNRDADVLCLESNYLQSSAARKLLWRYLSNGRGVVLLVNRVTPTIKGYLRELGFEAEGPVELARENGDRFQFVFSNHPIFHPFLSSDYGNLTEIRVSHYERLKVGEAMPLIFSTLGHGLFFESTKSPGKLFVAAFGLDREHTSWPVHQTFIPFLDLMLQSARSEDPTPTNFEPGEVAQLPAPPAVREVVLRGEQRELARVPAQQGRAQVRFPDQPGLYALAYDTDPQIKKIFSVNPPSKESQLTYVDAPEAIKSWRLERPFTAAKGPAPTPGKLRNSAILQQRWWWWMLLGGAAMLLLETALAEGRKVRA